MISPSPSVDVRRVFTSAYPFETINRSYRSSPSTGFAGLRYLFQTFNCPCLNDVPRPWAVTHTLPFHAVLSRGKTIVIDAPLARSYAATPKKISRGPHVCGNTSSGEFEKYSL